MLRAVLREKQSPPAGPHPAQAVLGPDAGSTLRGLPDPGVPVPILQTRKQQGDSMPQQSWQGPASPSQHCPGSTAQARPRLGSVSPPTASFRQSLLVGFPTSPGAQNWLPWHLLPPPAQAPLSEPIWASLVYYARPPMSPQHSPDGFLPPGGLAPMTPSAGDQGSRLWVPSPPPGPGPPGSQKDVDVSPGCPP